MRHFQFSFMCHVINILVCVTALQNNSIKRENWKKIIFILYFLTEQKMRNSA